MTLQYRALLTCSNINSKGQCSYCRTEPQTFPAGISPIGMKAAVPQEWVFTSGPDAWEYGFGMAMKVYGDHRVTVERREVSDWELLDGYRPVKYIKSQKNA